MADTEGKENVVVQQIPVKILTGDERKVAEQTVTDAKIVPQDQEQQSSGMDNETTTLGKKRGLRRSGAVTEQQQQTMEEVAQEEGAKKQQQPQPQQSQQPQQQQSSGMDNKINSLVQKSQIYLELLSNPQIITTPDNVFKGDIEKIVTADNIDDPLAKTLYVELKKCLVELGDMYNMRENVLINVLSEYLNNAQTVIETLGENKFNEEKQALDGAKCNPGDSDAICKEKINKAMERINALKDEMKKIIDDKKGNLAQFDARKTEIEGLKTYFSGLSFPEDPTKVDELIAAAETKKESLSGDGEKELLTKLVEQLNALKNKLGEQKSSVDEQKQLEEEEAQLQQELQGLAAEQATAETNEEAARLALQKGNEEARGETLDKVEDEIENIIEQQEEGGEQGDGGETSKEDTPQNQPEETSGNQPEGKVVEQTEETSENQPEETSGNQPEETSENQPEETSGNQPEGKKVEQTDAQEDTEEAAEKLNDEFADLLEGTGIEVVGDDVDEGETTNPPAPQTNVGSNNSPIERGAGVEIVEGARKQVERNVAGKIADIETKVGKGGLETPQLGGRRKQSKKRRRRRKGKRKSKKNRH